VVHNRCFCVCTVTHYALWCLEYGDKENSDLGDRFDIKKDDWPEYRLFLQGKSEPIAYTGDETQADDIQKFVVQESGKFKLLQCFWV